MDPDSFITVGLCQDRRVAHGVDFVHSYRGEFDWHRSPDCDWAVGQWVDPSGVMVTAGMTESGVVRAARGYLGDPVVRARNLTVLDGGLLHAEVVGRDGETTGWFRADTGQVDGIERLGNDETMVVVTGLIEIFPTYDEEDFVQYMSVYPDTEAFRVADGFSLVPRVDSDPPYFEPLSSGDGDYGPDALVCAEIDEVWTVTVEHTGERLVVARIEPLDGLGMHVCWPEAKVPLPEPGYVLEALVKLSAFVPDAWRDLVERAPESVDIPIDEPDPTLRPLSVADAALLHAMFRETLDRASVPWGYDDDTKVYNLFEQGTLTLGTLAAFIGQCDREVWPQVVDERVWNIARATEALEESVTVEQLFPRVQTGVGNDDPYPVTDLVHGLEVLIGIDTPHSVRMVPDADGITALDLGSLDEVMAAAFVNLDALPIPTPKVVTLGDEVAVHIFEFEDYFGASRLLRLQQVVRDHIGPTPFGVLAAIPDRQVLMVVVLDEGPAVAALSWFMCLVQDTFENTHGRISRFVYHQSGDGPVEPVARIRGDGALQIAATEHFTAERIQLGVGE